MPSIELAVRIWNSKPYGHEESTKKLWSILNVKIGPQKTSKWPKILPITLPLEVKTISPLIFSNSRQIQNRVFEKPQFYKKYFFKFVIFAIFAIATVQKTELGYLRNCEPSSKTKLGYLRNCDFFAIAIRNFAIIAIFAIYFTTLHPDTDTDTSTQINRIFSDRYYLVQFSY